MSHVDIKYVPGGIQRLPSEEPKAKDSENRKMVTRIIAKIVLLVMIAI